MKKSIRSILAAAVILVFALLAIGSGSDSSKETTSYAWSAQSEEKPESQAAPAPETTEATTVKRNYKLGETFTMADFEVTLGTNYSIVKIDNQFSDDYGKDVVKLPTSLSQLTISEARAPKLTTRFSILTIIFQLQAISVPEHLKAVIYILCMMATEYMVLILKNCSVGVTTQSQLNLK